MLGIPIQEGRDFTDGDMAGRPRVVIVNRALVRAAFAGRGAIGRVIIAGYDSLEPMTIVGVVGDVRQYGPAREPQPEVYMPYQQHSYNGATLRVVARSATDSSRSRSIHRAEGARAIARGVGSAQHDERARGGPRRHAEVSSVVAEPLRRGGPVPCDGGHLWRDGLHRRAADEGDRPTDGARGERWHGLVADAQPWTEADLPLVSQWACSVLSRPLAWSAACCSTSRHMTQ